MTILSVTQRPDGFRDMHTHAAEYCNGSAWTGMGGRPTLSNYVLLDANTAYTVTQDIGWHHACFITRINNGNCPNDCDYHVWPFPPGTPNAQGQFHWQMLVNGHVGEVDASCLDYP